MARENTATSVMGYQRIKDVVRILRDQNGGITFFVPGDPQGKARAQSAVVRKQDGSFAVGKTGRAVIRHFTPKKTVNYEASISAHYRAVRKGPATDKPVILVLEIIHPVPESWPRWKKELVARGEMLPVTKPDGDNVEKAIKDALNKVAWLDDTQVVGTIKVKRFGADTGVGVTIIPLAELPSTIHKRGDV